MYVHMYMYVHIIIMYNVCSFCGMFLLPSASQEKKKSVTNCSLLSAVLIGGTPEQMYFGIKP